MGRSTQSRSFRSLWVCQSKRSEDCPRDLVIPTLKGAGDKRQVHEVTFGDDRRMGRTSSTPVSSWTASYIGPFREANPTFLYPKYAFDNMRI